MWMKQCMWIGVGVADIYQDGGYGIFFKMKEVGLEGVLYSIEKQVIHTQ